jgi:hypothetical protein
MLEDLKLKIWSAAIAAAVNSPQPGGLGYGALIPIAFAILSAFAQTIRQSLPASWRDSCRTEVRALQAHIFAERGAHQTPDA